MYSITTLTAVAATLALSVNGIPVSHGSKHDQLHAPRALDVEPKVVKLAPVMAVRDAPRPNLDIWGGTCGGTTGFVCDTAAGACCSRWGYCGWGELYCSAGAVTNGTAPHVDEVTAAATGYGRPSQWGTAPAPAYTSAQDPDTELPAYTPPVYNSPAETSVVPPSPPTYQAPDPYTTIQSQSAPSYAPPPPYEAPAPAPTTTTQQATTQSTSYSAPSPSEDAQSPPDDSSSSGTGNFGTTYETYSGDGSTSAGWPSENEWASFDVMWNANVKLMKEGCRNAFDQDDNSDDEIADIKSAIEDESAESGLPKQYILAVMMQESVGCVRAPTTAVTHSNPGLFQSHDGKGSCNTGPDGVLNPCPSSMIRQMVKDGVQGTDAVDGDGLVDLVAECHGEGAQKYYEAARKYNSGSSDSSNLDIAFTATPCYCTDIANRLTTWAEGVSQCTF